MFERIKEINELPHGELRLNALSNAIADADAAGENEWRFYFRNEYIKESIFHGDSYKAIICFPELLQIFDEDENVKDEYSDELMWTFKNVLENTFDFYQISREQIETYFEEFRRYSRKNGLTDRMYHMKKCKFYLHAAPERVKESYDAFHREKRDLNSDCEACEMNFDMKVALFLGDEENALRIAAPLLEGKKSCAEVPQATYGELTKYYLYKNDLDEALYYGIRCERMIGNEPQFLEEMGTLLELYSAVDPEHGWKLLKASLPGFIACHNPQMRMDYARGAYRLLHTMSAVLAELPEEHRYTKNVLLMPLPLQHTEKGISIEAIRDYFYEIAREQSERLDARNGNSSFMDILRKQLHVAEPTGETAQNRPKVLHGLVAKQPSVLAVSLPQGTEVSMETLEERIRSAVAEGDELIDTAADEENELYISLKHDGKLFEWFLIRTEEPEIFARPVAGLDNETFSQIMENPQRYIMKTSLGTNPMEDYAFAMRILSALFPEMLGMVDLSTQHAYPASWVHYVAVYPQAVETHDMFGIYITGSQELNEVWMQTLGMNVLGMRDLEIIGATTENFHVFADMLDEIAAQIVNNNMLPDAGKLAAVCYLDGNSYTLTWGLSEDYAEEGSIAAQINHENSSAMLLVMKDEEMVLPTAFFDMEQELEYPNSNRDFHRRLQLAKATFGIFRDAAAKPSEMAAARMEFSLDDDAAEKYGYGIELLWGDVSRVEDGRVYIRIAECSDAVPQIKEGDEYEVTAETIAGWIFVPQGSEERYTPENGYLLGGEDV